MKIMICFILSRVFRTIGIAVIFGIILRGKKPLMNKNKDDIIFSKLKQRYSNIHPVIFYKSLQHTVSLGHLFDVLEVFKNKFPVKWDCEQKSWHSIVK